MNKTALSESTAHQITVSVCVVDNVALNVHVIIWAEHRVAIFSPRPGSHPLVGLAPENGAADCWNTSYSTSPPRSMTQTRKWGNREVGCRNRTERKGGCCGSQVGEMKWQHCQTRPSPYKEVHVGVDRRLAVTLQSCASESFRFSPVSQPAHSVPGLHRRLSAHQIQTSPCFH